MEGRGEGSALVGWGEFLYVTVCVVIKRVYW